MELEQEIVDIYGLNLEDYKPLANKRNKIIKKINDDNITIRLSNGIPLTLNGTAYDIFELCNGVNDIKMIIDTMYVQYDVDLDKIREDIVKNLYSLWKIGLIVWCKEKNPFLCLYCKQLQDDIYVKSLLFQDVKKNMNLFEEDGICDAILDKEIRFTSQNIYAGMESMTDYYFTLESKGKIAILVCISAMMSVMPTMCNLNYKIDYLYINSECKDIADTYLEELLRWAGFWIEKELRLSTIEDKLVYFMKIEDNKDKSVQKIFENLGFKLAGRLKKELADTDVLYLQKVII